MNPHLSTVDRVRALVVPILADLSLDLYDLEFAGGKLVITVDRAGGVDLDTIALATRLIGRDLDHEDPIPGRYNLEITSPGLERSLRTPDHFRRSIGATVAVRTHPTEDVPRRVHGVLVAADDDAIVVRADEGDAGDRTASGGEPVEVRVPLAQIDRAKTVFSWGPGPKPGSPGAKKPGSPGSKKKAKGGPSHPTVPQEADAS
jgi:ribosome maturation factor RimP